ncbi:MAG: efflux RND transporter periplasmic adaptor subunit [Methyloversatilis discipulorum]|uniref:efflux RND transporter periplasmic adaptor subunit n=1 Tax=Methyloversatilis discipulorum TaxID=1119528 RepID=UPI0026F33E81|nr:efflux RND transporter periplasmic adaptor subunit [Methyloversatilis discipulorum]MBV5287260.1 efflux RND transporter periplasmic adaptor subunit [Methyloversatilis discipulorum]
MPVRSAAAVPASRPISRLAVRPARRLSPLHTSFGFVVLIAAALLLSACSGDKAAQPAAAAPQALPVTVIEVAPTQAPLMVEAVAQAEGAREVEVRARVSGILEKWLFREGEPVKAGQMLFRIERAPFEIALAQAKARLAEAQAVEEQTAREAQRLTGLVAEKAISQKEFDDARSASAVARAAVKSAEAAVREAELNLSYTQVSAPVAGVTGRAHRSEGSLVNTGSDSLLTTIAQINPIWVRFSLSDNDLAGVPGGRAAVRSFREVELQLPDGSILPQRGRINFSASRIDPALGTLEMRAEFANADAVVLPGQFVRARVIAGERDNVFLVPQAAVTQTENGPVVMLANAEGKVEPRPVKLGQWQGKDWVVTGGLQAGDRVIVDNLIKLRPGAPVAPRAAGEAAPPAKS